MDLKNLNNETKETIKCFLEDWITEISNKVVDYPVTKRQEFYKGLFNQLNNKMLEIGENKVIILKPVDNDGLDKLFH